MTDYVTSLEMALRDAAAREYPGPRRARRERPRREPGPLGRPDPVAGSGPEFVGFVENRAYGAGGTA